MKSFHKAKTMRAAAIVGVVCLAIAAGWVCVAEGALPLWIRNVDAKSALEAVFFRWMALPGGEVMFRRPPNETRPALGELIQQQPLNAELHSLRALEDEQALDFAAAEADWKQFAEGAADKTTAQLRLADFYHRRLRPEDEIRVLSAIATSAESPNEKDLPVSGQTSWRAFERIFGVLQAQGSAKEQFDAQYKSWIARYPQEASLYARYLQYLVEQKQYAAAARLIAQYQREFPEDAIFPVKAEALVQYHEGSIEKGLAVYEKSFEPLWSPELVKGYFDLLAQTQNLRKFLDQARAERNGHPEDLRATAKIFYYYQQQGKLDAAQQAITELRAYKDSQQSPWSSQELFTCARLMEEIHAYPEAARFYFALYNSTGMPDARERALSGLTSVLLTAPEAPIRLGSGNLSMYRNVATMDLGPGYLNGILSLVLNTTDPASEFAQEEQKADPYFRRAQAAELLKILDAKYPRASERAALHAQLIQYYADSGESEAVLRSGQEFLAGFADSPQRTAVALLMADAYSRAGRTEEEFAIYDSALKELAEKSRNIPLGLSMRENSPNLDGDADYDDGTAVEEPEDSESGQRRRVQNTPFQLNAQRGAEPGGARSPEYARVLERYLARLVELKQIPRALQALRRELDRNPNDPGLYERLAVFLQQNRLGAEQEEVYKRAIAKFPDKGWYDKLARYYLRYQRDAEFEQLTREAVQVFNGTELERYFQNVVGGSPQMYLRLNLYANARFPHNRAFVRNLLSAYQTPQTRDPQAWEALIRQHWFEEADLQSEFFEYLSRSGKLEPEMAALQGTAETAATKQPGAMAQENPAAGMFLAEADLWRSHYEESAPLLLDLAKLYPADTTIGTAASSVFRSLAYFAPADTAVAAKIEENLLSANPGNTDRLARIGDIYADRALFSKASPYWQRIPEVAPGESSGYLDAATIYWDYYDFDHALQLLDEGRKKQNEPSLYAYEEGAIYEGKRDYAGAIREYVKGSMASSGSPSQSRLMQLALRPKVRDVVEHETLAAAALPGAPIAAISLRANVLELQGHRQDLESFLDTAVQGATTLEGAAELESIAQQKSLETVRQHALEKQAALATDPVTRLQLRCSLVQLYESRKDFSSAQSNLEAIYRENPKILGVVRSTVDFYWRTKQYPKAIGVLQEAAHNAYPALGKQFQFEAARKSTEAKLYTQARQLLSPLLQESPYNSEYLAAMADTYAQADDATGLKKFYLDEIDRFRSTPLSPDDKKIRVAALRRGLIPALTQLGDFAGAIDQYIELINAFPEDESLTTEAALYALRNKRAAQLTDYYAKTAQQSPRDFRWPMVLARAQTSLENYPAAIAAYAKSIDVRPDRTDLRIARAALSERLLRFDDAAADYTRVYELAYKDPTWMERVAEIRARQGRVQDAIAALKAAILDPQPEQPGKYFDVARRLETWGMLAESRTYAEKGIRTAGAELLADPQNHDGAKLYARIMTRLRHPDAAVAALQSALAAAQAQLPVVKEQIAREGIAAITDREWRQRAQEQRLSNARTGMRSALAEMGSTVARYFTPEEKAGFAEMAKSMRASMNGDDLENFAIPLAQSAGLADLEAQWRYEAMQLPGSTSTKLGRMRAYVELQRQRLQFKELGAQLERFAPQIESNQRHVVWLAAANAYRSGSDPQSELRTLSAIPAGYQSQETLQRYFQLLLAYQPDQLVQLASSWTVWGERAADFAVANGNAELLRAVVAARGQSRLAIWTTAYRALTGFYLREATPAVQGQFVTALGDQTVGERIGKSIDRGAQLAGDVWFYYGSRYGEYLEFAKQPDSEDFLPAELEHSPASESGYESLADYRFATGNLDEAIVEYRHGLELAPGNVSVHDRLAESLWKKGLRQDALVEWKSALTLLSRQSGAGQTPDSFWTDFSAVCGHVRAHKLFPQVKDDVDALLRAYLRHNGNYRSNLPLRSAFLAYGDPAAAVAWVVDLSSVAPNPADVLADISNASWIPLDERGPLYQAILEAKQNAVEKSEGLQKDGAQEELRSWQIRWITYLVQSEQFSEAKHALSTLPQETKRIQAGAIVPLELRVAAHDGTLDVFLNGYRSQPQDAPSAAILRGAAQQFLDAGDKAAARKVLEFTFAREIEAHQLVAANFLGLAEIRIAEGDTSGGVELLRRLTAVVGEPFENLDPAAALLEKTGHEAEAVEFLDKLVQSAPWKAAFQVRLAKARLAAGQNGAAARNELVKFGSSGDSPYSVRLEAATALASGATQTQLGSAELDFLANPKAGSVASVDQRYSYESRIKAAEASSNPATRISTLVNAVADAPARDEARLALFQAAAAAKADELALGAVERLMQQRFLTPGLRAGSNPEQESTEQDETESASPTSTPTSSAEGQVPKEAQLARTAGQVLARLHRWNEAQPYLQRALQLMQSDPSRKDVAKELAMVRAELRWLKSNEARQPILHQDLEQDRLVRPKLLVRAATRTSAAAKGSSTP